MWATPTPLQIQSIQLGTKRHRSCHFSWICGHHRPSCQICGTKTLKARNPIWKDQYNDVYVYIYYLYICIWPRAGSFWALVLWSHVSVESQAIVLLDQMATNWDSLIEYDREKWQEITLFFPWKKRVDFHRHSFLGQSNPRKGRNSDELGCYIPILGLKKYHPITGPVWKNFKDSPCSIEPAAQLIISWL